MLSQKVTALLERNRVHYRRLPHPAAYTSQGVAATTHVPGWNVAKSVVLKVDGAFVLAVVPAPCRVDLQRFQIAAGAEHVALATEAEFRGLFPGCDLGAEPPFGELYGLPVWVDSRLVEDDFVVFNAGSHTDAVRIAYKDFERLARPRIARIARP